MELSIEVKTVYGKETIYPRCNTSKLLAEFKGQKTLTERDLKILKEIGYTFRLFSKYNHLMGELKLNELPC